MNPSRLFIGRPVATALLTIAVILAGAIAYRVLPVSPLPQVDFPTISVGATLPGASAEIMASSVATPLERQFGHIAGVSEITSASSLGNTSVTLQFDLTRNIDGAARDVEAAINAARAYLPANLPTNPTYRKVNPADAPIMVLGLTSEVYGRGKLYDVASTVIQQKLSQISGVGQVNVSGGALPAVRVEVDPLRLNSAGLTLANVQNVLNQQNTDMPRGQISSGDVTADIVTNGQLLQAADYRPLVIGSHAGAVVRLADVAEVIDSVQDIRTSGYLNGKGAVMLIIFRQPGANIIETVDEIRRQLPFIRASIPTGIDTTVVLDRTTTIRASVKDMEVTLLTSTLLVVAVVFAFLRDARATLVPSIAVPVSLIGTFAAMYLFGFSLDNLSLMSLTISTGFVIDDAIVVMENIARHIEDGMKPHAAALRGAAEIGFTVFSISVSLVAVFTPILLMGGIVGRLFREFAITLSTAIAVSMVVSLVTTPTMCAHLLKARSEPRHPGARGGGGFSSVLGLYRRSLVWVLGHPGPTIAVLLLMIVLNGLLMVKLPKGFFPTQDTGTIAGGLQGPQDASFAFMDDSIRQLANVIKSDPAVDNVVTFTGGTGNTNGGFIFISLKPLEERRISAMQVIDRLRPRMNALPVASAFLQPGQDLRIGGRISNALYQYTIQSERVEDLARWGDVLLRAMRKLPGFEDVNSDQQNGGLEQLITYDRSTAARVGVTALDLDSTLYAAFGQSLASVLYTPSNQYREVLEVSAPFRQGPESVDFIYLNPAGRGNAPLQFLASGLQGSIPLAVNHTALLPSVTVSFNLAPGISLSEATRRILEMQRRTGAPSNLSGHFAGTLEAFQTSLQSEPLLIAAALVAVYIVLGILYESLIHPLTIISTLPSASVGAMLALLLFRMDLNIISLIGIVLLIGIVKKNAIMMIDFALVLERAGKSARDAIFEASLLRFRPIMMTTSAALFGALPLALGTGLGSELRRPLGITIVGGLLMSQMLTLYTTPVVYLVLDRLRGPRRGGAPDHGQNPVSPFESR